MLNHLTKITIPITAFPRAIPYLWPGTVVRKINLPNKITILRLGLIPFFILFFVINGNLVTRCFAVGLLAVIAASDLLDGYLARRRHETTFLGEILDPIADKFLIVSTMWAFLFKLADFPRYAFYIIVFREAYMFVGLMLIKVLKRKMIKVSRLGRTTNCFQVGMIFGWILKSFIKPTVMLNEIIFVITAGTVVLTLASAIDYTLLALQTGIPGRNCTAEAQRTHIDGPSNRAL
ncbi:MAG: CDP-alcohol phosphatidyltransferase family protein [bacterium]|nr:CDP-alcohol phosphatidyltransferase family protein [bacterium]